MKKNQKKREENKISPAIIDESYKIQKQLDEREEILVLQCKMVQATLEWAGKKLNNLVSKHKMLKKKGGFENEDKIFILEAQMRLFVNRIEMEQNLWVECQKIGNKLNQDKENFILSQLTKRLSNIIPPTNFS